MEPLPVARSELQTYLRSFVNQCAKDLPRSPESLQVLDKKQIAPETIRRYEIGWTGEDLEPTPESAALGLTRGDVYSYRNRLIFPVYDYTLCVSGFTTRCISDFGPKWLDARPSLLFQKSNSLFGLQYARWAARFERYVIIVEGPGDCIAMAEAGFKNTVAPMGSRVTPDQARLLYRMAPKAVLLYDGDKAGEIAQGQAAKVLRSMGMAIAIAELPQGADPESVITQGGVASIRTMIDRCANLG